MTSSSAESAAKQPVVVLTGPTAAGKTALALALAKRCDGEIINADPQLAMCNVYGVEVPKADGRAGMAAILLLDKDQAVDIDSLSRHIHQELPSYARPVFLRIQAEMDTTGTFKMVKGDLRKEAYELDKVDDPIYVLKPGSSHYALLDRAFLKKIKAGKAGF